MNATLDARRVRLVLLSAAAVLVCLSFGSALAELLLGLRLGGLVRALSVDQELSLPSWWSELQLATAAATLFLCAQLARKHADRFAPHWAALCLGFAFLSVDELVGIHEKAGKTMHALGQFDGFLRFAWVVPGLAVVGGAIGFEMIGGKLFDEAGTKLTLPYQFKER